MNPLIERTGWTLLHSLWEGGLIWAGLQLTLLALRRHSAQSRYLAGCAALVLAVLLPLATFLHLGAAFEHSPGPTGSTAATNFSVGLFPVANLSAPSIGREGSLQDGIELALPWIVLCWVLGCVWEALKLTTDCVNTGRLMTEKLQPLPDAIMQRCQELAHRLGLRRGVRLGESLLVDVPSVAGWLKPVILVPVGAFSGLSGVQIDALLAHELAHISRHDFLVNVLQSICEVGFFFNPAVLAINGCIRRERENACDDAAVALTGAPLAYASALAQLEEARQPKLLLAASGQGELFGRIRRLAGGSSGISIGARLWIAFVLALLVAGGAGYWQMQAPKMYSAVATVQFEKPTTVVIDQGVTDPSIRSEFDINTYLQDMQSNKVRELVVAALTPEEQRILLRSYVKNLPPGQPPPAVGSALGSVSFEPVRNSFLVRIMVYHQDPEAAAIVANKYADKFMDYLMDNVSGKNEYAVQYLQDRSYQLRREYEAVQVKLEESRRKGITDGAAGGGESATDKAARDSLVIQSSVAEANYRAILNRLSQATTTKNMGVIPLHVLDTAMPSYAPVTPVYQRVFKSCLSLGIVVFLAAFVILSVLDFRLRFSSDAAPR